MGTEQSTAMTAGQWHTRQYGAIWVPERVAVREVWYRRWWRHVMGYQPRYVDTGYWVPGRFDVFGGSEPIGCGPKLTKKELCELRDNSVHPESWKDGIGWGQRTGGD